MIKVKRERSRSKNNNVAFIFFHGHVSCLPFQTIAKSNFTGFARADLNAAVRLRKSAPSLIPRTMNTVIEYDPPLRNPAVKKSFCLLIFAMVTPLLSGCFDNGSPADPPTNFTATPGEGRVKLAWNASPGVDYWLFTATDAALTAFNWLDLPNAHVYITASTPYYMCGLFNGTLSNGTVTPLTYYFAANGRINGGPGGPSSPTVAATPYNASAVTWTVGSTPAPLPNIFGVGYTSLTTCTNNSSSYAGSFAAVGAGGAIFTSADGKTWSTQTSPIATALNAITGYATNQNNPSNPVMRWIAVGDGGASVYSTDGITWAIGVSTTATTQILRSITQVTGTFFAVGDSGTILSTTDGITWTSRTSGTANNLNGVTHGANYVAVGNGGTILTSIDGNTWTVQTPITPSIYAINLRQVTSYGSIIVAVGDTGTIVTSKDGGITWTSQSIGTQSLVSVAAETQLVANAAIDLQLGFISTVQFVAVDSGGNAYTSTNGYAWSATPITTGATSVNALVSSGFGYVAAGNSGITAYAF